ncbi:G1 S-specific cyclin-D2 [Brachionus plicatilis]|uniref:G1 S-specific cyclin-D2 n=1 Tax=Brachionus plicatilis TaxID=10195 RepID=A0A3M7PJ53_BRAPC|nr:G1 S-specific cyclin-D2 [Brachionus plicatilis]
MTYDQRKLENMMNLEQYYTLSGSYLCDDLISESMRQTLLEWMRDLCQEENKLDQVFNHSCMLFDRFMQALKEKSSFQIHKSYLQLFATACLFISSKVKSDAQFSALNLIEYTDNSITLSDLLESELFILETLEWDIDYIVPNDYFEFFSSQIKSDNKELIQTKFYEQTVKCSFDFSLQFYRPSQIATVCLLKALHEISMFHLKDLFMGSIVLDSQMNKLIKIFQLDLGNDSMLSESWSSFTESGTESPVKKSAGKITKRATKKMQRKNSLKMKKVLNSSMSSSSNDNDESMTMNRFEINYFNSSKKMTRSSWLSPCFQSNF